ncbi:MAG: EscU/YscU/HrcU family type III secretion system export apparatus switch protein [Candidatus Eremiobacteraeota bacterium]|nr:EscU/YscU/HrcU family type III secretion system export apparatus switch protein [Candidatus Eremiobacteraeota bacterium]
MNAKPFEPTSSRLAQARRDGDHPLSHDCVAVAAFASALAGLAFSLPPAIGLAREAVARAAVRAPISAELFLFVPVVIVTTAAFVGAMLATLAQTRSLVLQAPGLRWERLSPAAIRRLVSLESLRVAVGAGLAVACLGIAVGIMVASGLARPPVALESAARAACNALLAAFALTIAVGSLLAIIDLRERYASWRGRLRMTVEEARRDQREHDGDPQTRARRRRLHKTLLRGSLRDVRRASFVVVNPTHLAVALRYAPPEVAVPAILVRASERAALRLREAAERAGIPLIENVALARALWAHGSLGPIPRELYLGVAQIIASLQSEMPA